MKTNSRHRADTGSVKRRGVVPAAVLLAAAWSDPGIALAQQVETMAVCDEPGIAEPVPLSYGDSTSGCLIDTNLDTDLFTFSGQIGDTVRFTGISTTAQMDPQIEVRNDMGSIIATGGCNNFACGFELEIDLPKTGIYLVTVFDDGFNEAGGYTLQLHRIVPAVPGQRVNFDATVADTISPGTDIDHYFFNATAGTDLRLNARSTSSQMDPAFELRDPNGTLVLDGAADGAQCNNFNCSFSVDFTPAMSGDYSLIVHDTGNTEPGAFEFTLWCVFGPCDSDGDGTPDPQPPVLAYDDDITAAVITTTGASFFRFNATAGTTIRFNALSTTTQMDPTLEVRDPTGALVIDGAADGAQCPNFNCSFSVELTPAMNGWYSVLMYDSAVNESGDYELSLWCLNGACDSDANGTPDPQGPLLSYPLARDDLIDGRTDGDFFRFNATAGTLLRLGGLSTSAQMDPTVEIRDPTGALVIDGAADGAQCSNFNCSFATEFSPAMTGLYSVLVYDFATNESGAYQLAIWCVEGDCDSDTDSLLDDDREALNYASVIASAIDPQLDADFYLFQGTPGDQVRINVASTSTQMDPTIEVRDPAGTVIINGPADGGQCSNFGCTFSVDILPGIEGTYAVMIYDGATNEAGNYDIGLQCVFGAPPDFVCSDLPAALPCADNCSSFANPAQVDTSGDGIGNQCDPDLNDDLLVNFGDLALFKSVFFPAPYDPDADFNSDGFVNFGDLARLKQLFLNGPGPSCAIPNYP